MYNLQLIEERIMSIAKKKGLTKNKLLLNAKLHKGVFDNMKKGQIPSVDKIHIIADYLDVSVDYLLGRTDEQTNTHYTNNINDINDSNFIQGIGSITVHDSTSNQPKELSKEETEILDIYRSLNIREKAKFLNMALDIEKEKIN